MRADLEKIVWAAECHPKIRSWKITLLNLCHHANGNGDSFPSVVTVARETGYSQRAVIDALAGLEAMGIIRANGRCGQRQRVTVYNLTGIFTSVHNLANSEVSSCLRRSNSEVSSVNSEVSSVNSEVSSVNSELTSCRSNIGNNSKLVSRLVGVANSEVSSPFVDNPQEDGAESGEEDYSALVKTPGWKPKTDGDRRFCMAYCYTLGASRDEAQKFIRYNAVRRWTCCEYGTVNDAAKEWVAKWREDHADEFFAERERRKRNDATKTLN